MRILSEAKFMELPGGTVYRRVNKDFTLDDTIEIKGDTGYISLHGDIEHNEPTDCLKVEQAAKTGEELPVDFDGFYSARWYKESERLYAVYSNSEAFDMLNRLKLMLEVY